MPEIIRGIEQGTPEWKELRLGSIGGSSVSKILANGKGREDLLYELASERLSGVPIEQKKLWQFKRGHEFEPKGREWYEFIYDVEVEQVTLIKSDTPGIHVSPDGLIPPPGGLEIKVRLQEVFTKMRDKKTPIAKSEIQQIQHMFSVYPEMKWCDHLDYCPEMPFARAGWVRRVTPDPKIIASIRIETARFISELGELVGRMK